MNELIKMLENQSKDFQLSFRGGNLQELIDHLKKSEQFFFHRLASRLRVMLENVNKNALYVTYAKEHYATLYIGLVPQYYSDQDIWEKEMNVILNQFGELADEKDLDNYTFRFWFDKQLNRLT